MSVALTECDEHASTDAESEAESESPLEPACSIANADYLEWRKTPYTAALADIYPPCENPDCFPDGVPEPDAFEHVIRSRHCPTVFHRPRDGCAQPPPSADQEPASEPEPIESITDLRPGDGVVWGASQLPLVVMSATSDPAGTVALRGPNGGEYELDELPGSSYAVSRGYGCVSGVRRIPAAHTCESVHGDIEL